MTQTGATLLLIALILVAVTLLFVWWQWQHRNNTFIRALREISHATGESDPYQPTRLLMLGNDNDNHLLCRGWGLSDGVEYWFGRWWFNTHCSVLCVPQTLQSTTKKHLIRQNDWQKTLTALVKSRSKRPLDGLVITLSLDALLPNAETTPVTENLLRNCQQIQQICGLSLPIYLLISGLETFDGTDTLLERLPENARQSPIGSPILVAREAVWKAQWIDEALENARFALRQAILEMGTTQGDIPPVLFRLPEQLTQTAPALHSLFDPLLSSNTRDEPPQLRGIWFVSRQKNATLPQMFFSQKLLDGKILAEQGLALPVRRLLRLNMHRQFITLACCSCLFVVWLATMLYSWKHQHKDALLLHDHLLRLASQTRGSETSGDRAAALYWRTLNGIPTWQFQSVIWPGSLFSQTDRKLQETFHNATLASLLVPATNSICLQNQDDASGEPDNALPDARYRQVEQLLAKTKLMESRYLPLLQLLQVKRPGTTTFAAVSSAVWGTDVDTDSLPQPAVLNRLFSSLDVSRLNLPDATALTQRNSERYTSLTRQWLEQSYDNTHLDTWLAQLEQLLEQFSARTDIDATFVRTLVRQVSRLQNMLATITTLNHDAAHSTITLQLNELLRKAQPLKLIDDKTSHALRQHDEQLRQRLLMQLDNSQLHFSSLTEQTPEGDFTVSSELIALQKSLRALLNQPFWLHGAGTPPPARTGSPGNIQLRQALTFYDGYQRFIQHAPDSLWRSKITALAANAVENAMIQTLYSAPPTQEQVAAMSTASADRVIDAFNQLHRPALANALRQQVAAQVIAQIRREGSPLLPSQDSVPAISYASQQQAQLSGQQVAAWANTQTEQISTAIVRHQQDIAWLDAQRPWLSVQDNRMVTRWQASLNAMQRLQQQDLASPPAQMSALAAALPTLTAQNCQTQLAQYSPPAGQDFYSQSLNSLLNEAHRQCSTQRHQADEATVQQILALYNEWLAGHFPFTPRLSARDADPDRVKALVQHLALLPAENKDAYPPLVQQLLTAQPLLSALISPQGVTVKVTWRTSRLQEVGADQIAQWQLSTPQQTRRYPGNAAQDLHWRSGESLQFSLRWAANSSWRPVAGSSQPGVTVSRDTGLWRWHGPWALLRMIGGQRVATGSSLQTPLRFALDASNGLQQTRATVFLQLSLLDPQGNAPLPWGALFQENIHGQ